MDHLQPSDQDVGLTLRGRLLLLMFGLFVFGYLLVIGNPHWFELRPVSTAAVAMSSAADKDSAITEPGS